MCLGEERGIERDDVLVIGIRRDLESNIRVGRSVTEFDDSAIKTCETKLLDMRQTNGTRRTIFSVLSCDVYEGIVQILLCGGQLDT